MNGSLRVVEIDPLDDTVDTANTGSVSDLDLDEAIVAPPCAPRVLYLPVVHVTLTILLEKTSVGGLVSTGVPPLGDLAATDWLWGRLWLGCGLRLWGRLRLWGWVNIWLSISEADDDDGVVESSTAIIGGGHNSRRVPLEGGLTGIESDSKWVRLELHLDILDAGGNLSPFLDFADSLVPIVLAISFAALVWVVFVFHGTVVSPELPMSVHPATVAAIVVVGPAEQVLVGRVVTCAVNTMLLGESHWLVASSSSNGTLEGCGGGKGSAGTALTLVLDWAHPAVGGKIDIHGVSDQIATSLSSSLSSLASSLASLTSLEPLGFPSSLLSVNTEQLSILFSAQVRGPVVLKSQWILLVASVSSAVNSLDDVISCVEVGLGLFEGSFISDVLVEQRGELEEVGVVALLVFTAVTIGRRGHDGRNEQGEGKGLLHLKNK